MKISVKLDTKSIKNAISVLQKAKKQINTSMLSELLTQSCNRIIELANNRIQATTIGSDVITDIMQGWNVKNLSNNMVVLQNSCDKAVYVEFGVGKVGQQNNHPNAQNADYKYNVPSESKTSQGQWVFGVDDENEIDLQSGNYVTRKTDETLWIITKGSPATMFLYNACRDFIDRQEYKNIWKAIKKKYWG